MKRPRKPAQCQAALQYQGEAYRCANEVRSVAEVAAELRDFPVRWRANGVHAWSEHAGYEPDGGAGMLAYAADVDLPAFALELEGKLCRRCAAEQVEKRGLLLKLVFIECLGLATARDERPWEEFELARCAA